MSGIYASLLNRVPPWMALKAKAIIEALPKDARIWAESQGKLLARSPNSYNQTLLIAEIKRRFLPAGASLQNQQTIINGLTSAVLLFAISELPPPAPGGTRSISGGARQPASPSIDIETKKLERMIQKRSQLFDMLSQIMARYDATAKNIIQSLGR